MLVILLAVVAVAALFYHYFVKPLNHWKDRAVAQGKLASIIRSNFGILTQTITGTDMLQDVYNQSPGARYTGMYTLHFPILVIKDPELIKQMTIKDFDHFTDHIAFLPKDTDDLWENSLVSLQGQKWREMRSVLSPSFTSSKMRSMFVLMLESTENFIQYFLKKKEDVIVVEMKDAFSRFATDVIATTACGIKVDSLAEPNNEFYLMGQKALDFNNLWKNIKFLLSKIIPSIKKVINVQLFSDEVSTFFRSLINETIRVREENGVVRRDMIHLLLETRSGIEKHEETDDVDPGSATAQESSNSPAKEKVVKTLSNEEITAQALIFFIGGFDSVSSLTSFMTYELALNQEIQDRLRKEILSTWEECGEKLTYEALLKMKYMDMVVSESLRKWPNNIETDRVCTKPYTIEPVLPGEQPINLKKGDAIWLPIFSLHRDPNYYPNPEKFDPERFNDENKGNINPCTFMPFGIGPRNCIGYRFALLEAKLVVFYILLHFKLVPVEKTPIPMKISKKSFALNAEGGFWLGLKRIKKEQ